MVLQLPPKIWRRGGTNPMQYRPSLYLSADRSVYQDAAVQFTAADKSMLQIAQGQYSTLAPRTGDLLVCGWWRIDSLPANLGTLLLMGRGGAGNGGLLNVYAQGTGKVYVEFFDGTAGITPQSDSAVFTAEQWCFVALYFDRDGNLTLYANGISVGSADISSYQGDMTFAKTPFRLGGSTYEPYLIDHRTDSLMFFKKPDLSAVANDIIAWAYNGG
ncbi:MAG: LamG domain-containing protein, partial [Clostridiaceae bacterium]|nr:LamG domain-containing protein [Clostridiaceae bacterium]